jgi:glycosyltransferase EpsE
MNQHVAFVSCAVIHFDDTGEYKITTHKEYPEKKDFINNSPFVHAASMIRKSMFDAVGGYSESRRLLRVEDYHLWFNIYAKGYRGANIQKPLYKWRDDNNAYKRRTLKNRLNEVYARFVGFKMLRLPIYYYIYCMRPILVYLLPRPIYRYLHNRGTN